MYPPTFVTVPAPLLVTPPVVSGPGPARRNWGPPPDTAGLLRDQLTVLRELLDSVRAQAEGVEAQKEQLALLKAQAAAADGAARWRSFLARWDGEFPGLGGACKKSLPAVERAYLGLVREVTDRLADDDGDGLDTDFGLAEFLDKYAMRLHQLGTVLGQLGALADGSKQVEG